MTAESKPFFLMNVFTPKPGKLDEFLELQASGLPVLRQGFPGSRGGSLYRARR
jgi:hypothetical protein